MSTQSNLPPSSRPILRIDTQHYLLDMMKQAVARIHTARVNVDLFDDSVLLTGSVESWYDKQCVQENIRELSGQRTIQNQLQIQGC